MEPDTLILGGDYLVQHCLSYAGQAAKWEILFGDLKETISQ